MKKAIVTVLVVSLAFVGCAKKKVNPEVAVYDQTGKRIIFKQQPLPEIKSSETAKGYIPTHPFPPFPAEAQVYSGIGHSNFKADLQTAIDVARISALGELAENISLEADRTLKQELKNSNQEFDGVRLTNTVTQLVTKTPVPGRKFTEPVLDPETGEVAVRIYVSKHEADKATFPVLMKVMHDSYDMGWAAEVNVQLIQRFNDPAYLMEERRQIRLLQSYHYKVMDNMQGRVK